LWKYSLLTYIISKVCQVIGWSPN